MLLKDFKYVVDGSLSNTSKTSDGFLVAKVRCARTGIQIYAGDELGKPELEQIRVHRPESEVFAVDSMASYAGKTVTNNHPPEIVGADNWKKYSIGTVGGDVARDGEFISVPMMLMDGAAIKQVEAGKREISMGYLMDLDFTAGTTEAGEAYDAVMTNLRMNHLAIVDKGRAGSDVRIGDANSKWGVSPTITDGNDDMKLQTLVVDGLSVETTDQGATAIVKLQGDITTMRATADTAKTAHDAALAAKDTELATKDSKIAELEKQVVDGPALDKLVADRATLITKASAIAKDADFTGKSDLEVMTAAVIAADGPERVTDKSEAYIEAAFDMLKVPEGSGDTVRDALMGADLSGTKAPAGAISDQEYDWNIRHLWMGDQAPKFPGAV